MNLWGVNRINWRIKKKWEKKRESNWEREIWINIWERESNWEIEKVIENERYESTFEKEKVIEKVIEKKRDLNQHLIKMNMK